MAIANQKGGVGKSTTAVSLGAALAERGFRVLVVDLDPQGNASTGLGIRHEARENTVYNVVVAEAAVFDAIVHTPIPGLDAVPSTIDLAGAEIELVSQFSRETRLKKALAPVGEGVYDFVLLDCPPSLGLLTINALTAAEELIVPIQCEYYALEGLGQLLRNVNLVQQNINPGLRLTGIVMTMFDPRTKLSEQVVEEVKRFFGPLVYDVIIPRTVRLSEAPGFGQPITVYDSRSKGAETYRELAREVASRPVPEGPLPTYDELPSVVVPPIDDPGGDEPPDSDESTADPARNGSTADGDAPSSPVRDTRAEGPLAETTPLEQPPSTHDVADLTDEETGNANTEVDAVEGTVVIAGPVPAPDDRVRLGGLDTGQLRAAQPQGDDDLWEEADRASEERVRAAPSAADPANRHVVVIDDHADLDIAAGRGSPPPQPDPGSRPPAESGDQDPATIGATLEDEEPEPKRRWRLFRKGGE